MQQRMKRVGMRWRAAGADTMLALRSIYRSTGAWDRWHELRRGAQIYGAIRQRRPRAVRAAAAHAVA